MYYVGDHGESLGENGLYLHGLPYVFAPEAQKHVASLLWLGAAYRADVQRMRERAAMPASHDNYFHTVLGLLEVESAVHDPRQDLIVHADAARQITTPRMRPMPAPHAMAYLDTRR
jgi:lipid A ethanolaminephosphotransferase